MPSHAQFLFSPMAYYLSAHQPTHACLYAPPSVAHTWLCLCSCVFMCLCVCCSCCVCVYACVCACWWVCTCSLRLFRCLRLPCVLTYVFAYVIHVCACVCACVYFGQNICISVYFCNMHVLINCFFIIFIHLLIKITHLGPIKVV